jgi:1,4-alpha-glucan branching enzyme
MGWMHDTLSYLAREPVHRQWHHDEVTFSLVYAWTENFVLPISHDEVVHGKGSLAGKMPGDTWQRLANTRAMLAFMWAHPGKQLLFMGSELAEDREWNDSRGLDWDILQDPAHAGVQRLVRDLNRVDRGTDALWSLDTTPEGFRWIIGDDSSHNTLAFLRRGAGGSSAVCVVNFAAMPHENYRVGLPWGGRWREVINTDAAIYGGSGVGNLGAVRAQDGPHHGLPASARLRLPPLGALWFVPEGEQ